MSQASDCLPFVWVGITKTASNDVAKINGTELTNVTVVKYLYFSVWGDYKVSEIVQEILNEEQY